MDLDFAISGPLVRPRMPRIRFLFVGSRFCSALPPDTNSRWRPCASLVLHLPLAGQGTFTPELSNMLGTPLNRSAVDASPVPPAFYLIDKRSLTGDECEFFENRADVFSLLRLDDLTELDILGIEPFDAGFKDGSNLRFLRL
jgi:hypothetical protein